MGDKPSIFGFAALGFSVFPCEDGTEAAALLKELKETGYGVIYVTEALAKEIPDAIRAMRRDAVPAVILIPGLSGNTGEGRRGVEESVEKAVGSKLV